MSETNYLEALMDVETGKVDEVQPKHTMRVTLKPPQLVGTGVETPEHPRLSCREIRLTTAGGYRHTDVRGLGQESSISL